jgi:hypothetical protein
MVLAAQLHYEQSLSWQDVCLLVNGRAPKAGDREALDEWLLDPAVLSDLAYRALYCDGPRLVQLLLELPARADLLDLLAESPIEGAAIVWRYGFGEPADRVCDLMGLSPAEMTGIERRCDEKMEISGSINRLIHTIMAYLSQKAPRRICKRLAFEYRYRDELAHKDVLTRLTSPARVLGYRMTAASLNMWLGGHRLLNELRAQVEENE